MADFLLIMIMIWVGWFLGGVTHEDDLKNMCMKSGYAKGLFVELKCSEMKTEE